MNGRGVEQLLLKLKARDIHLRLVDDQLRVSTPKEGMPAELRDELKACKQEILDILKAAPADEDSSIPELIASNDVSSAPLSFGQQRSWFVHELNKGQASPYDTLTLNLRIRGVLNVDALEHSLIEILRRHEVLRMVLVLKDDEPLQMVEATSLDLEREDISHLPTAERECRLGEILQVAKNTLFDLTTGPLFKTRLIRLGKTEHMLGMIMHHIVFDAWSNGILMRELKVLYENFAQGRPSPLPELPIQYRDFSIWQRNWLQGEVLQEHLGYWIDQLADLPILELPTDHPRPALQTFNGASKTLLLSRELSAALQTLSKQRGVTLHMTMLSVLGILLNRYSGQDDFGIGTPIANRDRSEVQDLIGFFLNMLVMRLDLSAAPSFTELLERVKHTALAGYAHQHLPFEKLVEKMKLDRDTNRTPLFQITFTMLDNQDSGPMQIDNLELSPISAVGHTTRFDLEVYVRESSAGLALSIIYNTDLFNAGSIRRMLEHYLNLLQSVAAEPDRYISELPMLSQQEQQQLIEWNQTTIDYPRDKTVHELFEAQAAATPDAIAVDYNGDTLIYSQLNERANRIAHFLRKQGVGPEVMVGFFMERSLEMIVGLLGILKAGGAYVPLDLDYPQPRIAFMLEDTAVPVILTQSNLRDRLPEGNGQLICLDSDWPVIALENAANPESNATADNLAYVIYTSGSTGTPKGVEVPHGGLMNLVSWHRRAYEVSSADRATHLAGLGFDASVWELWPYLTSGASLYLVSDERRLAPTGLWSWMATQGITLSFLPTPLAEAALRAPIPEDLKLRVLLTGGDRLHGGLVKKPVPFRVVNHYGPTENSVVTTFTEVDVCSPEDPPIGRPIDNVQTYILDKGLQPVPLGIWGELYIGGEGLARGYLNQPELTAEKFIPNPFSNKPGARLYRSGDLVRYREDGQIEFQGRIDHQVKVRGFRVELGEIESVLSRQPGIKTAVVLVQGDEQEIKRLVAYLIFNHDQSVSVDVIRNALQAELPAYMVPSAFIMLDELPLTPNGKLDRDALPALDVDQIAGEEYLAPRGELETRITEIWRDLLGMEKVGIRDNFFDLGGHSLLMSQVQARLTKELDRKIPMLDLFQYPTIESLSRHLGGENEQTSAIEKARARMAQAGVITARDHDEAIAIIGMAGRFPGAASVEQFWENLANGVESVRFFTDEELTAAGIPEQLIADPRYVPAKGYLDDADLFDAAFFGYPPREAELLDPQQRIFLECAWEVLERAGYDPERYQGLIGVYAGSSTNSYRQNLNSHPDLVKNLGTQVFISSDKDFLPTRVSYKLNLHGPSVTVQTACSTSLVAIHEACKSLLGNECDIALAGGVSVSVPRVNGYMYQEGGIQSPDGHCRAFSADAKGMVGGDGIGIVALKRLSEAKQDGDIIHAVIRGSAINNDGSNKVGYTAPSVEGQAEVIALAQAAAGVTAGSIDYIETHGTGTELGDPIEVAALTHVFGENSNGSRAHRAIGAVKTNIGHLDAAAGVAGIIKTALALKHSQIPPSLNYKEPNPEINFDSGPFYVNTKLKPWETADDDNPRRAGVSSFGIGGTNAHAVLEQAPAIENSDSGRQWQLLPVSAKNEVALDMYTDGIADYLQQNQDANLADVSFMLRTGRGQFDYRRAVICKDHETAVAGLRGEQAGQSWTNNDVTNSPPVIFMFPGQGSQYARMGQGLYETETAFREIVDDCCEQLKQHIDIDLRDTIFSGQASDSKQIDEQLRQTLMAQCSLFVIEYALAKLWMSWGIQPAAMIGHSIGEYVAACISGVINLDEALLLIASRGQAMEQAPPGAMLSVLLSEKQVIPYLHDDLWLSVINGHSICVVSGTPEAIDELEQSLKSDNVEASRLHTSGAFHSGLMDDVVPQLVKAASKLNISSPGIPYISNVTGTWIDTSQLEKPEYWGQHLRNTVRFAQGVDVLLEKFEQGIFLEVGPGKSLGSMLRQSASDNNADVEILSSLRHPSEQLADGETVARALAGLWLQGVNIDWQFYDQYSRRCKVELPTYPFQRQSYWVELATGHAAASMTTVRQPLKDWFYIPVWKSSMPLKQKATDDIEGRWLVLCDNAGISEKIKQWLQSANCEAVCVLAGKSYAQHENGDFTIEPGNADDYLLLVENLQQNARLPKHVIHLWAVTPIMDGEELPDFSYDPLLMCYHSLICLTQALGRSGSADAIDINVISNNAHTVLTGDRSYPEKATLLGPCAVIGQEHPNLSCRNIDIEISQQDSDVETLMAEILNPTDDMVVAYRDGQRWIKTHDSVTLDAVNQEDLPIKRGGVYLITGGLGGIGLAIADFLAQEFQARLVLTGRSELPPRESWLDLLTRENGSANTTLERIKAVQALEEHGSEVLVLQADVVDKDGMLEVLNLAQQEFGEINGVIHSAGLPGGRVIQLQSPEIATAVMAPKVGGTRVVGELCSSIQPDFMVLCSSLASVLGVAGQVDYCSANAFQDAYANYYTVKSGIPVIAINWDTWNESGMAVNAREEQGGDKLDLIGIGFNHREGIEAFKRILARATISQIAVSTFALSPRMPKRVIDIHSKTDAKLASMSPEALSAATATKYERLHPKKRTTVSNNKPESEMEIIIANIWEELLGIDEIETDDMFLDLGGHSLLALTVVNRLAEETNIRIPPVSIMNQTLRQLAASAEASIKVSDKVSERGILGFFNKIL